MLSCELTEVTAVRPGIHGTGELPSIKTTAVCHLPSDETPKPLFETDAKPFEKRK